MNVITCYEVVLSNKVTLKMLLKAMKEKLQNYSIIKIFNYNKSYIL
jgi:hypothetical protein